MSTEVDSSYWRFSIADDCAEWNVDYLLGAGGPLVFDTAFFSLPVSNKGAAYIELLYGANDHMIHSPVVNRSIFTVESPSRRVMKYT